MTLSSFILFTVGAICELLFLFEDAGAYRNENGPVKNTAGILPSGFAWLSPARAFAVLLGAMGLVLIGLVSLLGYGNLRVYIDTPGASLIFAVLGLTILVAACIPYAFIPPVNEQSILVVQALILLGSFFQARSVAWLPVAALTLVPALVSLVLLIWPRPFPPLAKAILYLWFLCSLMIIPFQNGQAALFKAIDFSWVEALTFGSVFVFMLLHGLVALRFFVITLALLLPRGRALTAVAMPYLFRDQQVPLARFGLVAGLAVLLLLANRLLNLFEPGLLVGLAVLVSVQWLNRRPLS